MYQCKGQRIDKEIKSSKKKMWISIFIPKKGVRCGYYPWLDSPGSPLLTWHHLLRVCTLPRLSWRGRSSQWKQCGGRDSWMVLDLIYHRQQDMIDICKCMEVIGMLSIQLVLGEGTPPTGGEGAWKATKTSWVHCRLWLKVPATYPPITDWVHSKCIQIMCSTWNLWENLCNIWNVTSTCTPHLIPHNS